MKRIYDAWGGIVSTFEESDGKIRFTRTQDVNPILERNKALQTLNDGYSPLRELKRVASIPNVVLEMWCRQDGISVRDFMRRPREYRRWLRRKLYDPDNRYFLTAPHKPRRFIVR